MWSLFLTISLPYTLTLHNAHALRLFMDWWWEVSEQLQQPNKQPEKLTRDLANLAEFLKKHGHEFAEVLLSHYVARYFDIFSFIIN